MGYAGPGRGGRSGRVRGRRRLGAAVPRHGWQGDHVPDVVAAEAATPAGYASSVMLLDCAKLRTGGSSSSSTSCSPSRATTRLDELEARGPGRHHWAIEPEWNDFDQLSPGDEADPQHQAHDPALEDRAAGRLSAGGDFPLFPPFGWLMRARRRLFGDYGLLPQLSQPIRTTSSRTCSSACCGECVAKGVVSEQLLREEMRRNHARHDAFEVIERTPPLAA